MPRVVLCPAWMPRVVLCLTCVLAAHADSTPAITKATCAPGTVVDYMPAGTALNPGKGLVDASKTYFMTLVRDAACIASNNASSQTA